MQYSRPAIRRSGKKPAHPFIALGLAVLGFGIVAGLANTAHAQLPAPPIPPGNPITPQKTILGKILFWDEQLSSDNTVACGTCHLPEIGGGDDRLRPTPGLDGIPGTPDDPFGSPGVVRSDSSNEYEPDPIHDFLAQITTRNTPSFIGAQYFTRQFWDGRGSDTFVDPQSGLVSLAVNASLESQTVGPPVNDVEMAHQGRSWTEIASKLGSVIPLKIASAIPLDMTSALIANPTYPALFNAAFGDPAITAERIAFSIATYERTLIPDQTPFDRFVGGDLAALTPNQQAGLQTFLGVNCRNCHSTPLFSDDSFHNVGLRPIAEDRGLQDTTGLIGDRGKFKTPSLRNVGLRQRYMHNGQFTSLDQLVLFYNGGGTFPDNRDSLIAPLGLNMVERDNLVDFLQNGLTDPRVANALPPFDRPTLHSELLPANPFLYGVGATGAGAAEPIILAGTPPNIANPDFRIGIGNGLGGATAFLVISADAAPPGTTTGSGIPLNIDPTRRIILRSITLNGVGPGQGYGTFGAPIANRSALIGRDFFAQWFVQDAAAVGGFSTTMGAELTIF